MKRQDMCGWAKSLVVLIGSCAESLAFNAHGTSKGQRIAWSVIDLAFCLGILRAIDFLLRGNARSTRKP